MIRKVIASNARAISILAASFQIVISLSGILALCLLNYFKGADKNEEDWQSHNNYSLYKAPIFWVMLALLIGHIALGASLATAAIMRRNQGLRKILAYPWIPGTAILLLTNFILQWFIWGEEGISYYFYCLPGQHSYYQVNPLFGLTIFGQFISTVVFVVSSLALWVLMDFSLGLPDRRPL